MQVHLEARKSESQLQAIANLAWEEVLRLDKAINEYQSDSRAGSLRRKMEQGVQNIHLDPELFRLLQFARRMSQNTNGAFDITVAPLGQLWKKCAQEKRLPTAKEIAGVREVIGWQRLRLDASQRRVNYDASRMSITLGGFVKGYAVDCIVESMRRQGIPIGMVELGGDLRVFGPKKYKIGIQDPRITDPQAPAQVAAVIAVADLAVATSGHYRRYVEINGQRYSHILDPRSCRPVDQNIVSVTVLAATAMQADAYATAFCVLPPDESLAIASRQKLAVLIVVRSNGDYRTYTTPDFSKYWLEKPDFVR